MSAFPSLLVCFGDHRVAISTGRRLPLASIDQTATFAAERHSSAAKPAPAVIRPRPTCGVLPAQAGHGSRDRKIGARRFQRYDLRLLRRALAFLPQGRKFLCRDRRTGRQAGHLRGEIHLRRRPAPAISDRISRRPHTGTVRSHGTAGRRTRVGSAGSISIPTRTSGTTTFCTGPSSIRTGISCARNATRPALRKNYDAANDRYATTWSEISVGCEACHGTRLQARCLGARAAKLVAIQPARRPQQRACLCASTSAKASVGRTIRVAECCSATLPPNLLRTEVETCGRCHARRSEISEDWMPGRWLSDTHAIASPIGRSVYWPDGQIRDVEEPYNYVPFKQSKMFAAGVTCSDCHDPHSGK